MLVGIWEDHHGLGLVQVQVQAMARQEDVVVLAQWSHIFVNHKLAWLLVQEIPTLGFSLATQVENVAGDIFHHWCLSHAGVSIVLDEVILHLGEVFIAHLLLMVFQMLILVKHRGEQCGGNCFMRIFLVSWLMGGLASLRLRFCFHFIGLSGGWIALINLFLGQSNFERKIAVFKLSCLHKLFLKILAVNHDINFGLSFGFAWSSLGVLLLNLVFVGHHNTVGDQPTDRPFFNSAGRLFGGFTHWEKWGFICSGKVWSRRSVIFKRALRLLRQTLGHVGGLEDTLSDLT